MAVENVGCMRLNWLKTLTAATEHGDGRTSRTYAEGARQVFHRDERHQGSVTFAEASQAARSTGRRLLKWTATSPDMAWQCAT